MESADVHCTAASVQCQKVVAPQEIQGWGARFRMDLSRASSTHSGKMSVFTITTGLGLGLQSAGAGYLGVI